MEEKKKSNVLNIIIVILVVICLGLGTYVFMNKDELFGKDNKAQETETKTDEVKETPEDEVEEIEETKNTNEADGYDFDKGKVVNGEGRKYSINHKEAINEKKSSAYKGTIKGVEYTIAKNDVVNAKITWATIKKGDFCEYEETKKLCNSKKAGDISTRSLIFDSDVIDIKSVGMGQDESGSYMLFFKKNGKIDYINEWDALEKMDYTHPTIKGIVNPVKVYTADVAAGMGGYFTALIHTKDDRIYDLSDTRYIKDL